jgi:hypothetical protein
MLRSLAYRADHLLFHSDWAGGLAGHRGEHWVEDLLERHYVCAGLPHAEKAAITGPMIVLECNGMIVIAAAKSGSQIVDQDALWFLGIAPRLRDLTDHIRVHMRLLVTCRTGDAAASALTTILVPNTEHANIQDANGGGQRYTNNKGGCRMIIILRRPCLRDILLAFVPA